MTIHPTAIVEDGAQIGADVSIGAYSIIGPRVVIGDGCTVGPHVVITGRTRIGQNCRIYQFASIGDAPQDKKYAGQDTGVEIGRDNTIRERAEEQTAELQSRGDLVWRQQVERK